MNIIHSKKSNVNDVDDNLLLNNKDELVVTTEEKTELKRSLSFFDSWAIVVGIIIGSGIFSSPGLALSHAGSPGLDLVAWAVSGCLVMITAQGYFELGMMMPGAGGDYEYLNRAYGKVVAFSFAFFNFFISKSGSQAIIATIFGRYVERIIFNNTSTTTINDEEGESFTTKVCAVSLIIFITLVNCAGIKESTKLQNALTILKIILVIFLFIVSLIYAINSSSTMESNLSFKTSFNGSNGILNFGSAMVACLWSFDGWADLNFMMEEILDVRQLPMIVLSGLATVTFIYLLANFAYLSVLSANDVENSSAIAVDLGNTVSGELFNSSHVLSLIFAFGVALSTMGSNNGSIMTGGRVFYAIARNGDAPKFFAKLNSAGAPWTALLAQGTWASILVLLPGSSFGSLLNYLGPCAWFYYALTSSSVIRLRYIEPDTHRPFKVLWYPLPPILVIIIASVIVISGFYYSPGFTSLSFGFVALSIPLKLVTDHYKSKLYYIYY
jgi:amino acid transporter